MLNTATIAEDDKKVKVIRITFDYDLQMIDNIRSLPGRKYYADIKCWSAPIYPEIIEKLKQWKFTIDPRLNEYLLKTEEKTKEIVNNDIPNLKGTLRPFQKIGVAFIESKNGKVLIADEMGLGKTVQALGWLELHPELRPVIIAVPASLKFNWEREAKKWMSKPNIEILSGENPWKITGEIVIVNYDILFAWLDELKSLHAKVLITDECHYFKNNKAKRTKSIKILGKNIPNIIALSGTPIENRPIEIYNAWKLIDPLNCPAWNYFVYRFCKAKSNGFGLNVNGASNIPELHSLLSNSIMIRRLKKDVLKELPDKTYSFIPIALNNIKEYQSAENDFISYIRQERGDEVAERLKRIEQLAKIESLKQLAVKGKLNDSIEWIRNFLEVDGKLIVFAVHKFVIEKLMEEFGDVGVKIDGSVSMKDRQKAVDEFQTNDKIRLFVGNIQASGVGLTLTASSNVAILEFPWTPGALVQCIARADRIGQKNAVNVYYLMAKNTIEEKIARLLDTKQKVVTAVLDGGEVEQQSLVYELMKEYK